MKINDKCGIVGAYSKLEDVVSLIFYGLYTLQHRGQESCGIAVYNGEVNMSKGMGMVAEFFSRERLNSLHGRIGIGHVRYSTAGASRIENAQPFLITHSKVTLAIAHNGNIVNYLELRRELERVGQAFVSTTDSEVIAHMIVREYIRSGDIVSSIENVMNKLVGSYSLVLLVDDKLIAVRDPLGIRPLCMGRDENTVVFASESVVFDVLNIPFYGDVKPGEVVIVSDDGIERHRIKKSNRTAHCMFEYIYFARPDSILNGIPVYSVREKIGKIHGEKDDVDADFVTPVPDSAIPFALGYSRARGLPYRETLIRNRYVGRTFILPKQKQRELAVKLKLNPMILQVKGKSLVLFDDSIVRGTTSTRIIKILREAGAREIHMRVGCPPIKSLCKLGIDMPTDKELIASSRNIEEIRKTIGADTLKYLEIEELLEAIGLGEDRLCLGCLTGEYPVKIPKYEQLPLSVFLRNS